MKRAITAGLLIISMIVGFGGGAKAAKAEVIFFQVKCVLPQFPTIYGWHEYASCGNGLPSVGVGTAFNKVANPALSLTNFSYVDYGCQLGIAEATFSINGITGHFVWDRYGTVAVLAFLDYSGGGFTTGKHGTGSGVLTPTTVADAQKLTRICHAPDYYAYNVGITLTGFAELDDVN